MFKNRNLPTRYFFGWAIFIAAALCTWTASSRAQSCTDENFSIDAALLDAFPTCDVRIVYKVGAVAGARAIPLLRSMFDSETRNGRVKPRCGIQLSLAAQTALAKLGDNNAFQQIAQEFKLSGDSHARLQDLTFLGDDNAMSLMLGYLVDHPQLSQHQDPIRSTQLLILGAIRDIGERRTLPDVSSSRHHPVVPREYGPGPPEWTADELIPAWAEWWKTHQRGRITTAPYESTPDPYLRCLARTVDWGFSEAILAIADRGGTEARTLLEKFPISDNWGIPTIPGFVSLGLAKLGDTEKWQQIMEEWVHGSDFTDAIEKLEYIGGKVSIGLMVDRFATLDAQVQAATNARQECVKGLMERYTPEPGETRKKYIEDSWCQQNYNHDMQSIQLQRSELLSSLPNLVKDPPLPANVPPTQENGRIWQNWWANNSSTAQFTGVPSKVYK